MIIEVPFNLGQTIYCVNECELVKHKITEIRIKNGYWELITNKRFVVIESMIGWCWFFKKKDAVEYLNKKEMEKDGRRNKSI